MASSPKHDVELGGLIAGRFELERVLGDGSFAEVYEAVDTELGRRVALKLFTGYARAQVSTALREARAMARINHENVLSVHDIGEHEGQPFLAIEYAQTDLHRWLSRGPARDPDEILHLFMEAGRGLAAAHDVGLVHHDFKPANVMVRSNGSVAVGDFGLARHLDTFDGEALEDDTSCAFGTLRYICPERLLGLPGDERGDQFSFCVALWEALAGREPFHGQSAQQRYDAIVAGPSGQPRARPHVVRALRRGLAPEPRLRHANMPALLEALAEPRHSATLRTLRRGLRPALTSAMLVAVFLLGVGVAREAPALDVDVSPVAELTANAAMDYARDMVFDDKPTKAVRTLMQAMPSVREADSDYRHEYLARIEVLATLMGESGAYKEAAMTYAAGIMLCQDLGVDATRLLDKRSAVTVKARARTIEREGQLRRLNRGK